MAIGVLACPFRLPNMFELRCTLRLAFYLAVYADCTYAILTFCRRGDLPRHP